MMTFINRGGEGREDKNKDRKATGSEGRGPEESASRALMRQGGGEGCGGRGKGVKVIGALVAGRGARESTDMILRCLPAFSASHASQTSLHNQCSVLFKR